MEPQPQTSSNTQTLPPPITNTEVVLPAPPEIELFTTNRDDMDDYVQAFGAHKHGYNIRKGNSSTGLICHYHCHRGGYPPFVEGRKQPTRSARIGCNFKMTARINHTNQSWMLIHIHLGHNHDPDHTVKPRKRRPKPKAPKLDTTKLEPHSTHSISDNTSQEASQNLETSNSNEGDASIQHHNDTSLQTTLDHVAARLNAMSPTTRQQKINQINCIISEPPSISAPESVIQIKEHEHYLIDVEPMEENPTVSIHINSLCIQVKLC